MGKFKLRGGVTSTRLTELSQDSMGKRRGRERREKGRQRKREGERGGERHRESLGVDEFVSALAA